MTYDGLGEIFKSDFADKIKDHVDGGTSNTAVCRRVVRTTISMSENLNKLMSSLTGVD
jgi:hypothetical protein